MTAATSSEFTVLDWLGFGVAALAEIFNVLFSFAIATCAFLPFALSLDGSRPIGVRRALVLGGAALALGTAVLLLFSMYLPIYAIAGKIK